MLLSLFAVAKLLAQHVAATDPTQRGAARTGARTIMSIVCYVQVSVVGQSRALHAAADEEEEKNALNNEFKLIMCDVLKFRVSLCFYILCFYVFIEK